MSHESRGTRTEKAAGPLSYRQDEWQIGGETEDFQKGQSRNFETEATGGGLGAAEIPAEVL